MNFEALGDDLFYANSKAELDAFVNSNKNVLIITRTNTVDNSIKRALFNGWASNVVNKCFPVSFIDYTLGWTRDIVKEKGFVFAIYPIAADDTYVFTYNSYFVSALNMADTKNDGIVVSVCGPFADHLVDVGYKLL